MATISLSDRHRQNDNEVVAVFCLFFLKNNPF